jgi:protein MpaA
VPDSPVSSSGSEAPAIRALHRLGKNINGYFGETIDIAGALADCTAAGRSHGWAIEEVPVTGRPPLLTFTRSAFGLPNTAPGDQGGTSSGERATRIYLSSGIHGDEPAGPLAMRRLLLEDLWPRAAELWFCPCLNPSGFLQNRRENPQGIDLNRDYLNPATPEIQAHTNWLMRQPSFDLCLCLHEDWESDGFYVYELNPDDRPSSAELMVARVAGICPINLAPTIEGRPAANGIIRPILDPRSRPQWPEAFYLLTYKTRLSYTLEAPSDYPLFSRVDALVIGVRAALELATKGAGR